MKLNLYGFYHKQVKAIIDFSKPTTEDEETVATGTVRQLASQTKEKRDQQKVWQIILLGKINDEDVKDEDGNIIEPAGTYTEINKVIFDYEEAINTIDRGNQNESKKTETA